jgi:hypothetical protein
MKFTSKSIDTLGQQGSTRIWRASSETSNLLLPLNASNFNYCFIKLFIFKNKMSQYWWPRIALFNLAGLATDFTIVSALPL